MKSYPRITKAGTIIWEGLFGVPHRGNDLPAAIGSDGSKIWYWHGLRHRAGDKPAIIRSDGSCRYYKYGFWTV